MASKDEILSLLNKYSHTVDTGDFDGFRALFEKGEWSVEGNTPSKGSAEIYEQILSKIILYSDGTPRTRHVTTNVELEVDEPAGRAKGQRYVTVCRSSILSLCGAGARRRRDRCRSSP